MSHRTNYPVILVLAGCAIGVGWGFENPLSGETGSDAKAEQKKAASPSDKQWGDLRIRFVSDVTETREVASANVRRESDVADSAVQRHSRGVQDMVVWIRHVSKTHNSYISQSDKLVELNARDHQFIPHLLPVMVGQTLKIRNHDPFMHIALVRPPLGQEMDLLLAPGDEVTWRFTNTEFLPIPVTCSFNPSMRAYIVVIDNPYIAVSDENGNAQILNLPTGEEFSLHVWHERSGLIAHDAAPHIRPWHVVIPSTGLLDLGEIHIPSSASASHLDLNSSNDAQH